MHSKALAIAPFCVALLVASCATHEGSVPAASAPLPQRVTGKSYRLEPAYLVVAHVPNAYVDEVVAAAVSAVGLEYGKYDQVAYLDAPGLEQFRPIEGSKSGAQTAAGRAPTTSVSFSVPRDARVLQKALDAIYAAHSYEEPVIYISEVWRTRSTNPDDKNPNRWWNRSGG